MLTPGPAALGRGLVLDDGQAVLAPWRDAPVHRIDEAVLADPAATVAELHAAWATRRPVVVHLGVDPACFRTPQSWEVEPWTVAPAFEPWMDRLHFLVWANTYDGRGDGEPVWWWARKAARIGGAELTGADQPGDVVLPDGRTVWIDGGPRATWHPDDLGGLGVVHAESVDLGRLRVAPAPVPPAADLAPDQLLAVGHGAGPARIIAPAGSGKTRVLTERLRHLVVDRAIERETVLAVAYNKQAEEELQARCAGFRPRVRTLNSLGLALLTQARGSSPPIVEERDVRRIVESLVPMRRHRNNTDPVAPYVEALGRVRLGLRDPEEVEAERDDVPGLAAAFGPYRAELRRRGAVDFDEQIYGAVEVLLGDGAFRRQAQATCRHLLVDEFQDLTPAHVLLLRLLAAPGYDVFGVGDDDQVIYGHAGADPGFLIGFEQLFPGAGAHPLEVNYRCPPDVVRAAATLLSYNRRRVAKVIRTPGGGPDEGLEGGGPAAAGGWRVVAHPPDQGASTLVDVVQGWLARPGVQAADIAVLARVNALLLAPQVALVDAGVPLRSPLRTSVLDRTGLRAALAYLRIAVADDGAIAGADVVEILRRPSRGLPQWFPDRLRRRSTWSLSGINALAARMGEKDGPKVERLAGDLLALHAAARSRRGPTRRLLEMVRDDIGLDGAMGLLDRSRGGEGSSHVDDLDALVQVAALHPDPQTFEAWLRSGLERPASADGVTLSTVHRVKGMEWPFVAVYGVSGGILPHRLAEDVEEERRVLHVAITRCRQEVVVLADDSRPSPFLGELDGSAPRRADPGPGAQRPEAAGRRAGAGRAGGTAPGPAPDPQLEQALRTWRSERSRRDGVPPFIVMHDRTLLAVAVRRPTSLVVLRQVDGIGPAKLDAYGEEILAVVAEHAP